MSKPNILFINTDQHNFDAISAYGNKWVETPNIDRLHANGISFTRSYCSDPVCAPTRASWMSGLYTSENGVPFNDGSLHDDITDLGELLSGGGYNTYQCGKWHVDGRDINRGFTDLYSGKRPIVASAGELYDAPSTHAAIDLLATYQDEKPWYLQIAYVNPHDICEVGHNYEHNDVRRIPGPLEQGVFTEEELPPVPGNYHYDTDETVLQIVSRRIDEPLIHGWQNRYLKHWSELQWRMHRWNYYRLIEKVDQEIGLLLAALEASPFKDNTLIIFSTDHGEAAGSHRMFQKFTLYEESVHVPFIVSSLGGSPSVPKNTFDREHFVSSVDLLPTVCDYAGVPAPAQVSGKSVRPLVENQEAGWRDHAYIESNYWGRAVIGERYKYVTEYIPVEDEDFVPPSADNRERGREQLFDLETDPFETRNLAGDAEMTDVVGRMRAELKRIESTIRRRKITEDGPQRTITRWGEKILEYWKTQALS